MQLNGKVINPGEMRTRISLQQRSVSTETGGFQTPTWTTLATVWARWVNAHGAEALSAASMGAEQAATVLIRWRSGLDTTCAVLKGSERYEIVSLDNIQERGEFIELKVKRMRSG
jgi:SPP1 family predicted phage head-tail adaptor